MAELESARSILERMLATCSRNQQAQRDREDLERGVRVNLARALATPAPPRPDILFDFCLTQYDCRFLSSMRIRT